MTPKCVQNGGDLPCTAEQFKSMSNMGKLVSSKLNVIAQDAGLPAYASQLGTSALANMIGSVQGAVESEISNWKFFSDGQAALAYTFGMRAIEIMTSDASLEAKMVDFGEMMVNTGLDVAMSVAADLVNIVPIVGAVVTAVFDLIGLLIDMLDKPSAYALAVQAEKERHDWCVQALRASPIRSSGQSDTVWPCDFFNAGSFHGMPGVGLGLIACTEANQLIPKAARETIGALRLAIQGAYKGQLSRGHDPIVGGQVPPTGPISDGGQSLWPIYMDQVLWQSEVGNLTEDIIFSSIFPFTNCALEITPYVRSLVEDWKLSKINDEKNQGYVQELAGPPVTPKQLVAIEVGSTLYAGSQVGVQYKPVMLKSGALGLVGPAKKMITFGSTESPRFAYASGKKSRPPTLLVMGLATVAGWGAYKLASKWIAR